MEVKLSFFGQLAEIVGESELTHSISDGFGVQDLRNHLDSTFDGFETVNYTVAVNQEFKSDDWIINSGDQIAVFPPFAGG